jgi:hypothetical protein
LPGGTADVSSVTFLIACFKPPAWCEVLDLHVLKTEAIQKTEDEI